MQVPVRSTKPAALIRLPPLFPAGTLTVGHTSGSTGTYTLSGGSLIVGSLDEGYGDSGYGIEIIGDGGNGTFIQTGGTNTINSLNSLNYLSVIVLGSTSGSTGTYSLSGTGTLSMNGAETIGGLGHGTFTQSGGTNSNYFISIGGWRRFHRHLRDERRRACRHRQSITVGDNGTGTLNHTGGTIQTDGLHLANIGSTGTYNLSGTGLLLATDEYLGSQGTANFNQTGGTNTVAPQTGSTHVPAMFLGYYPSGAGNYTISGGSANIGGNVYVGGKEYRSPGGTGVLTVSGTRCI